MLTETRTDSTALPLMLAVLADNKHAMGRRYAYWSNGAPTLEAAVAAAAMTQDEIGHARSLYPLLDSFAADGEQDDPMNRPLRYNIAALDRDFAGWSDFVAINYLFDTALTIFFEAAQSSSYEPLAQRARKIVQEERTHFVHGEGWLRRLAQAGGAVRADLVAALERVWNECLCWYGMAADPTMVALREQGIVGATPDALRTQFLARVQPSLDALDIILSPAPDWSGWHAERRRIE